MLFDTADSADPLFDNMSRLMVSVKDIEAVVISHDHWDHTGGLWEILRKKKGLKVYALRAFSEDFKTAVKELGGKLAYVASPTEIADGIFLVGGITSEYKGEPITEQSLVIRGEKGVSVITGCAHPGIVEILELIKKKMNVKSIYMAFGGFHLGGLKREDIDDVISSLKKLKVKKVGPAHCSGEKAKRIFKGKYYENFIPIKAGQIIQL